jgi:hypothetical protein
VRPLLAPTLTEKDAARIVGIRAKKNALENIVCLRCETRWEA